jgi:hypothetical protein
LPSLSRYLIATFRPFIALLAEFDAKLFGPHAR